MRDVLQKVTDLLKLAAADATAVARLGLDEIKKQTRKQLLALAKELELKGASALSKDELAETVLRELKALTRGKGSSSEAKLQKGTALSSKGSAKATRPAAVKGKAEPAKSRPAEDKPKKGRTAEAEPAAVDQSTSQDPTATAKLDLGPGERADAEVEHIPWGYGVDRITAAAIDPDKLYACWEVTDSTIDDARAGLGRGGPDAWLNVRVYDTTGLIFDGTNAHHYFDHRIERWDRQWFFTIGKPSSTAFVELGLKSTEGFFVKIARSSRVDFPRKEPAYWVDPEWMTVLPGTGQVRHAGMGMPWPVGPRPPGQPPGEPPATGIQVPLWVLQQSDHSDVTVRELLHGGWERVEWREVMGEGWFELEGRVEWQGPVTMTSWEAGPFTYPVQIDSPSRQEWQGKSFAFKVGDVTHVVYGPWQVVIRNLAVHSERAVLGRWEVFRSWIAQGGREVQVTVPLDQKVGRMGGSELLMMGASERFWLAASEQRLGGASEIWRIGASEIRLGGASERLLVGSSQWVIGGASERRMMGASETRLGGASERLLAGASELRLGGASERMLGGASERMGASERYSGGSERRLTGDPGTPASPESPAGSYPEVGK